MSVPSDYDKGLRWTAFAALVVVAVLAFAAGWMLPVQAPDGARDASSPGRHQQSRAS
ncbi:MAG: hypothetical protein WBS22_06535 [Methylocystis sp.]